MFQKMNPWSGGGGDYWDCRIHESFLGSSFYYQPLKMKITGMTGTADYQFWLRSNYQQYQDFFDFCKCTQNYPPGK